MTNQKDWFSDFKAESSEIIIVKGVMKGVGRGTIAIQYFDGNRGT